MLLREYLESKAAPAFNGDIYVPVTADSMSPWLDLTEQPIEIRCLWIGETANDSVHDLTDRDSPLRDVLRPCRLQVRLAEIPWAGRRVAAIRAIHAEHAVHVDAEDGLAPCLAVERGMMRLIGDELLVNGCVPEGRDPFDFFCELEDAARPEDRFLTYPSGEALIVLLRAGGAVKGVSVSAGLGDGEYPFIALMDPDGNEVGFMIDFIQAG